jgi:DNA-binding NtrC family response regulator
MDAEEVLLLDFHQRAGLGDTLRKILTAGEQDGLTVCLERVACVDVNAAGETPDLTFGDERRPALVVLILAREQLGAAGTLVEAYRRRWPEAPLVAVAEAGEPAEMLALCQHDVNDFITPPLKAVEILPRIWRLLQHARRSKTWAQALKERVGLRQIVGESEVFLSAVRRIPLIAKSDATVLVTGETGTGKEVCARTIHYLSPRADRPFVPVNCGAIPTELVENELFGHERGTFTGAVAAQAGLVKTAEAGTLFLDEIDCMPLSTQVKLLRFLQEREYRPLGAVRPVRADVRLIAATNSDCDELMNTGKLRQDLFYRLNVIPLKLPPLRERREDIPRLACHFLDKYAALSNRGEMMFDPEALLLLTMLDWPGNVRELENVVARAVALSEQPLITPEQLHLPTGTAPQYQPSFKEAKVNFVAQFERTYIQKLLVANHGNITLAAQAARKNRRAFWQLIRKHHIDVRSLKLGLQPK